MENKPFDKETINKIIELEKNEDELNERFHSDPNLALALGPIIGSNRINKYTISKFSQGLTDYLNKTLKKNKKH